MLLDKNDIDNFERIYRLNLINSVSGIKPANLIATKSKSGKNNLAIFSSVVHLGSNPAQLGFVVRPQGSNPRDTYQNILDTQFYTINHVSASFIKKAHYTSANLESGESEFERMNIQEEFIGNFHAPFVKESVVKIGMKNLGNIPLPNSCTFVIGSVELIVLPDDVVSSDGQIDLSTYGCAGISGLNTYYGLEKLDSFPYVRTNELPNFK